MRKCLISTGNEGTQAMDHRPASRTAPWLPLLPPCPVLHCTAWVAAAPRRSLYPAALRLRRCRRLRGIRPGCAHRLGQLPAAPTAPCTSGGHTQRCAVDQCHSECSRPSWMHALLHGVLAAGIGWRAAPLPRCCPFLVCTLSIARLVVADDFASICMAVRHPAGIRHMSTGSVFVLLSCGVLTIHHCDTGTRGAEVHSQVQLSHSHNTEALARAGAWAASCKCPPWCCLGRMRQGSAPCMMRSRSRRDDHGTG